MLRAAGIFAVCASLLVATPALADSGSLPGGTSISAEITSPAANAVLPAGRHDRDRAPPRSARRQRSRTTPSCTSLDVSGSTGDSAGVDCDGVAGERLPSLTCEKAAVSAVNADATGALSPVLRLRRREVQRHRQPRSTSIPRAGTQVLTAPGPNIDDAVATLAAGGGTELRRPA